VTILRCAADELFGAAAGLHGADRGVHSSDTRVRFSFDAGLTLLAMYLLGIIVALLMAWLFKKTLLKSATPMLIMELPPYKHPVRRWCFVTCGTGRKCFCGERAR